MIDDALAGDLRRVILALEAGRPVPGDLGRWLANGLRLFVSGEISLDAALGLDRLSRVERIKARDALLREVAQTIPDRPAAQIVRQIATGRALPDAARNLLDRAHRYAPIPKPRQLLRIINE